MPNAHPAYAGRATHRAGKRLTHERNCMLQAFNGILARRTLEWVIRGEKRTHPERIVKLTRSTCDFVEDLIDCRRSLRGRASGACAGALRRCRPGRVHA